MERFAVKITNNNDRITYESIGRGQSEDPQDAHLYTRRDLAETKRQQYQKQKQWYKKAEIVVVTVQWPEE